MEPIDAPRPVEEIATIYQSYRSLGIRARDLYSEVLRQTMKAQPVLTGAWTVWEPDAFDGLDRLFRDAPGHDASGRFVPFWQRQENGHFELGPVTNYERPGLGDFYWIPKRECQLCALGAYHYPVAGRMLWITSEVAPIIEHGRCVGVVGLDQHAEASAVREHPLRRRNETTAPSVQVLRRSAADHLLQSLTSREREVHYWLSKGKSNDEIGIILGISPHTVKNHLERVFRKLGVENRYAAALTR